jgi:hypothetical protein
MAIINKLPIKQFWLFSGFGMVIAMSLIAVDLLYFVKQEARLTMGNAVVESLHKEQQLEAVTDDLSATAYRLGRLVKLDYVSEKGEFEALEDLSLVFESAMLTVIMLK